MAECIQATGRRKSAIARVRLFTAGDGSMEVNQRTLEDYFPRDTLRMNIEFPLKLVDKLKDVTIKARLSGGGIAAQADALRHGISRALIKLDPELRSVVKKEGLLTRDPREKERKKYGLHGARRSTQFSKR